MEIELKKHVDQQGMTIRELSEAAGISEEALQKMYNTGEFGDKELGVHELTNLMIALDITNVNDLVPQIK